MRIISNGGAVLVINGRNVLVINGRNVLVINGRAVSLDSQGCKPLVGVPNTNRESRSDGIGSDAACSDIVARDSNLPDHNDNAPAPPFPIRPGTMSRGLHPWLSNTIAPRFNATTLITEH